MNSRSLFLLPGALLLGLVGVAGACGGGGEALTLEEYFQRLGAANEELSQQEEEVPDPEFNDDDVFDEQEKQSLRENVDAFISLLEDFRDVLADLDPPDEVEDEHNETLARLDDFIAAFRAAGDRVQDAQSLEDLDAAFADVNAADAPLTQACFALQAIANDNNIDVDLECEEE